MGVRKPIRNRRLKNRNILDVRLRTRGQRLARVRMAALALIVAVGTVVGLLLVWRGGEWALRELVFENRSFAVRLILIENEGAIRDTEILRWSGVQVGDNLLALDLARVKRDLELVPMIRSAAAERIPPDTLRIRVTEREPVVRVLARQFTASGAEAPTVAYFVDGEGFLFGWNLLEGWGERYASAGSRLPMLLGVPGPELRPGRELELASVRAALDWATAFRASPMTGLVDVQSIDLSMPEVLQVKTGDGGLIIFSYGRAEEQLRRWRLIHDLGQQRGKSIQSLDLSITNNSPVVFLGAMGLLGVPWPRRFHP